MATRKKKSDSITLEMPGTIGGAKVILPKNSPSGGWPKINQGSHLTVKTFEDGRTELEWDDEALARDVREAIASVENKGDTDVKTKKTRKSK
jgi:hypothetical protein